MAPRKERARHAMTVSAASRVPHHPAPLVHTASRTLSPIVSQASTAKILTPGSTWRVLHARLVLLDMPADSQTTSTSVLPAGSALVVARMKDPMSAQKADKFASLVPTAHPDLLAPLPRPPARATQADTAPTTLPSLLQDNASLAITALPALLRPLRIGATQATTAPWVQVPKKSVQPALTWKALVLPALPTARIAHLVLHVHTQVLHMPQSSSTLTIQMALLKTMSALSPMRHQVSETLHAKPISSTVNSAFSARQAQRIVFQEILLPRVARKATDVTVLALRFYVKPDTTRTRKNSRYAKSVDLPI